MSPLRHGGLSFVMGRTCQCSVSPAGSESLKKAQGHFSSAPVLETLPSVSLDKKVRLGHTAGFRGQACSGHCPGDGPFISGGL